MKNLTTHLEIHDLAIVGLGREGWSSFQFIRQLLPHKKIILIDDQPLEQLKPEWAKAIAQNPTDLEFLTTAQAVRHPSWLTPDTLILKTPGLPLHHLLLKWLHHQHTHITSNTSIFYEAITDLRQAGADITVIGVTGTKGKSTTASFIFHLLQTAQVPVVLGGNIGVPPLDLLPDLTTLLANHHQVCVVLEQSCHQLDDLKVSPDIAVIQNITSEHLDFYDTFERYWSAKSSIAKYQSPSNVVIASSAHPSAKKMTELSPATYLDSIAADWLDDLGLHIAPQSETHIALRELPVSGRHTIENLIPGLVIAHHLGITEAAILQALKRFRPLPHRLERIAEVNGVLYVNDSLATTPEAAVAALESFADRPAVLIAGGYDRHQDFGVLAQWIITHEVRAVILFPPTGDQISAALDSAVKTTPAGNVPLVETVEHMSEAVSRAAALAQPGDVVLLSPASASFGEFSDYADRGNQFAEQVRALKAT